VTFARQRRSTLIFMTALAVIAALLAALCVGYFFGRRAGSTPASWKKRTSRATLGRLAVSMVALVIARRLRRRAWGLWSRRQLPYVGPTLGAVWRRRFYEAGFRALPLRH
jgi:CDP-diglyceride synthetase